MEGKLTQQDLEDFKNFLMEALYENQEVKNSVKESLPDYMKPYAHINPYSPDALEQIETVTQIMHPEAVPVHPAWVQKLIDKGLVDTDGKTVIAKSLEAVAKEIMKNNIQVTNIMLNRFINGKNNKPYSKQSINLAIEYANAK